MEREDLKSVSFISQALWDDFGRSEKVASDAVAQALALEGAQPARDPRVQRDLTEWVSRLLIEQASGETAIRPESKVQSRFYRLEADERITLAAITHGKWSYARVGRLLKMDVQEIEQLAWAARLYLGSHLPYPSGSPRMSASCPEFLPQRPWTQKFLDDELGGQERLFMQTHLESCSGCRQALARARNFIYAVREQVPGRESKLVEQSAMQPVVEYEALMSFRQSVSIFVRRMEIRVALLVFSALVGAVIYRWLLSPRF